MAIQYQKNTTYIQSEQTTGASYNQTIGSSFPSGSKDNRSLGEVGSILTGTVLQGGSSPIVEMNGVPIQVKTTTTRPLTEGEQIYLKVTHSSSSEITMKLMEDSELSALHHSGTTRTEIIKNTAKFVQSWQDTQTNLQADYLSLDEDASDVLSNLTEEEKAKLRQMGVEISSSNLTIVKNLLVQIRGKEQDAKLQESIDSIKKEVLLITGEADSFLPISQEQTIYLLQNNLSLSMDNLYKAQYSASSVPETPVSEQAYQQMQPQIQRVLQTAGLPMSAESEHAVQFLLNHRLPVTTDNLQTWFAIQDLNRNGFSSDRIAEQVTEQLSEQVSGEISGQTPENISEQTSEQASASDSEAADNRTIHIPYKQLELYFPTASSVATQIINELPQLTDSVLAEFSASGLPYTLENLSAFYQQNAEHFQTGEAATDGSQTASAVSLSPAAITAHRQLEELRLKMTWEASYALAKQDIHLRTRELTEVVDALREQEQNYYKEQFQSMGMTPTKDSIQLAADTNRTLQELPYLPASALGAVLLKSSYVFSLEALHTEGTLALRRLSATANGNPLNSYETLMTQPRRDMGDSIQKAFRNVDDLLTEQDLPLTEDNRRAVRILGYNQMEITTDAVSQIKAADAQVQELMQNLTPSVVLHLIRDGRNPLNMPVNELNALVQDYVQEAGITDEDTYSEFLQKLDRKHHISNEERQGYIGIYRLLNKVAKSDGKDIGTLVRNGQGITLQNLLSAHRSNRASGMDWSLDDSFGGIDATVSEPTIDQQILTGISANADYQSRLAGKLLHRLSPDMIDSMVEEAANGTTLEEFYDTIQNQLTEPIIDAETAAENQTDTQATADLLLQPELELLSMNRQQLTDAAAFMNQWNIFPSMTNLLMAANIQAKGNRTFQLLSEQELPTASAEDLVNHLTSKEDMEQAYGKLEEDVTNAIHEADSTGVITAKDIQALKQIRSGLRIMEKMSRSEQYEIPFSIDGTLNIIHLSVIRDENQKGTIHATIPDTDYGTLSADLMWKENHWEGNLSSDTDAGAVFLERHKDTLSDALDLNTFTEEPTTNELYQTARQLVVFIKQML